MNINKNSKIFITGHNGLVGSSICRLLKKKKYKNLVLVSKDKLNLLNKSKVLSFLKKNKPELIICCAAKVGGILSNNKYPADYLYQNLLMELNIIHSAYEIGIKKIIFLASSCIYPKLSKQPIKENYLLTGPLEKTNEGYALAKIAGVRLCRAVFEEHNLEYFSLMPTNLYGPEDNYDLEAGHVPASLMRRFHEAKTANSTEVVVWGTGLPRREIMHVDDLASACWQLLGQKVGGELINVGTGTDIEIREFATLMADVVGFKGEIIFDPSKPDGTPRKLLDVTKIHSLGWRHKIELFDGLSRTYEWYTNALSKGEVRGY